MGLNSINIALLKESAGFIVGCPSCKSFGYSITEIDFDGNGQLDLAVADPRSLKVYVFLVTTNGIINRDPSSFTGSNGGLIISCSSGYNFGAWINNVGDFNGDGYSDLGIGDSERGKVYILYGGPVNSNIDLCVPQNRALVISSSLGLYFGNPIISVEDINGDKYPDIGIGDQGSNKFYLVLGQNRSASDFDVKSPTELQVVTIESASGGFFGATASAVGDIDGDSYSDVAIGAPALRAVYVVRGNRIMTSFDSSALSNHNKGAIITKPSGQNFGNIIVGVKGFNGDNCTSLIIGDVLAKEYTIIPTQCSFINLGATNITVSAAFAIRFGSSVAALGDINEDKLPDIGLGDYGAGKVVVMLGGRNSSSDIIINASIISDDWFIVSSNPDKNFGYSMTKLGDINHDGCSDFCVADYGTNTAAIIYSQCFHNTPARTLTYSPLRSVSHTTHTLAPTYTRFPTRTPTDSKSHTRQAARTVSDIITSTLSREPTQTASYYVTHTLAPTPTHVPTKTFTDKVSHSHVQSATRRITTSVTNIITTTHRHTLTPTASPSKTIYKLESPTRRPTETFTDHHTRTALKSHTHTKTHTPDTTPSKILETLRTITPTSNVTDRRPVVRFSMTSIILLAVFIPFAVCCSLFVTAGVAYARYRRNTQKSLDPEAPKDKPKGDHTSSSRYLLPHGAYAIHIPMVNQPLVEQEDVAAPSNGTHAPLVTLPVPAVPLSAPLTPATPQESSADAEVISNPLTPPASRAGSPARRRLSPALDDLASQHLDDILVGNPLTPPASRAASPRLDDLLSGNPLTPPGSRTVSLRSILSNNPGGRIHPVSSSQISESNPPAPFDSVSPATQSQHLPQAGTTSGNLDALDDTPISNPLTPPASRAASPRLDNVPNPLIPPASRAVSPRLDDLLSGNPLTPPGSRTISLRSILSNNPGGRIHPVSSSQDGLASQDLDEVSNPLTPPGSMTVAPTGVNRSARPSSRPTSPALPSAPGLMRLALRRLQSPRGRQSGTIPGGAGSTSVPQTPTQWRSRPSSAKVQGPERATVVPSESSLCPSMDPALLAAIDTLRTSTGTVPGGLSQAPEQAGQSFCLLPEQTHQPPPVVPSPLSSTSATDNPDAPPTQSPDAVARARRRRKDKRKARELEDDANPLETTPASQQPAPTEIGSARRKPRARVAFRDELDEPNPSAPSGSGSPATLSPHLPEEGGGILTQPRSIIRRSGRPAFGSDTPRPNPLVSPYNSNNPTPAASPTGVHPRIFPLSRPTSPAAGEVPCHLSAVSFSGLPDGPLVDPISPSHPPQPSNPPPAVSSSLLSEYTGVVSSEPPEQIHQLPLAAPLPLSSAPNHADAPPTRRPRKKPKPKKDSDKGYVAERAECAAKETDPKDIDKAKIWCAELGMMSPDVSFVTQFACEILLSDDYKIRIAPDAVLCHNSETKFLSARSNISFSHELTHLTFGFVDLQNIELILLNVYRSTLVLLINRASQILASNNTAKFLDLFYLHSTAHNTVEPKYNEQMVADLEAMLGISSFRNQSITLRVDALLDNMNRFPHLTDNQIYLLGRIGNLKNNHQENFEEMYAIRTEMKVAGIALPEFDLLQNTFNEYIKPLLHIPD